MLWRFYCIIIVVFVVLAFTIIYAATGNAESLSTTSQQMVEVSYNSLEPCSGSCGALIIEPKLPNKHRQLERAERGYFYELYNTAASMCEDSIGPASPKEASIGNLHINIGFPEKLIKFNVVRSQLNKFLSRFKLGIAPGIEDFSHVGGLEFFVHSSTKPKHKAVPLYVPGKDYWEAISSTAGTTDCQFATVNVGMK